MREPMRLTNLLFLTVYLFDCENYLGSESIGVRAGGARGAAAPPNFGQLRFFGQHEYIWAKPVFKDVSMFLLLLF